MAREATELAQQAVKEGISLPGQETSEAPKDANSSASSTEQVAQPSTTDANVASPQAEVKPDANGVAQQVTRKEKFEDNPGFKKLRSERDTLRQEMQKAAEREERLLAALEGMKASQPKPPVDERESAKRELIDILGLGDLQKKLDRLEARNADYSSRETDSAYDKEEDGIRASCEKFGMKMDEVLPELQNYLDEHPVFSRMDIQPGMYDLAFKALYFDKSTDLAKNAARLDEIKQRDKLRQANTEAPSTTSTGARDITMPSRLRDHLRNVIRDGGGAVSV